MIQFWSKNLLLGGDVFFEPVTFLPSTDLQTWVVPKGVNRIKVDCVAGSGYTDDWMAEAEGKHAGYGGRVETVINVYPQLRLYIYVGSAANPQNFNNSSDIRTSTEIKDRIVVAGGGGSLGMEYVWGANLKNGGNGGGLVGENGEAYFYYDSNLFGREVFGRGGTQTSGGIGTGPNGSLQTGGVSYALRGKVGSLGGYGYYGGAASSIASPHGGQLDYIGGAGGGSSYTDPEMCSEVKHTQGFRHGNGYVTISSFGS